MQKTFYIIDDHEMIRSGTTAFLESNSDWKGCGNTGSGEEALADLDRLSQEGALPSVIASTASPYKFSKSVLEAVAPNAVLPETEFDMVDMLHEISGMPVPAPLAGLKNKTARFSDVTSSDEMSAYVLKALSIE